MRPSAIQAIRDRVSAAESSNDVLAAAWDAFDITQNILTHNVRPDPTAYAGVMFAIVAACEGRDELGFAPSMPTPTSSAEDATRPEQNVQIDEEDVADLATCLDARLRATAVTFTSPADRQACLNAAESARQIVELLGG